MPRTSSDQPSVAKCDYCSAELGCPHGSVRAREYWAGQGFAAFYTCDECLLKVRDEFPKMAGDERLWALRLLHARNVNLLKIDEAIKSARGIVVQTQLDDLLRQRDDILELRNEGELVAAMWAAQALQTAVHHLQDSLTARPDRALGAKFRSGRKPGTTGAIRKAIGAYLKENPKAKSPEIWKAIETKPPRGWMAMDNRHGRYFEGSKAGEEVSLGRFQNICTEERKQLRR